MTGAGGVPCATAFPINHGYLRLTDRAPEAGDDGAAFRKVRNLMAEAPALPANPAAQ
jgi:hypothetical protein